LKKTILVIDDDGDILNIIAIILKNRGHNVITDRTGNSAENLSMPFPSLVILDIALNGYDGRQICKKLKSDARTAAIPVLLFSANLDLQHICKEYHADDYLTKPFEISELIKKVDALLVTG
jgi:DNA-binding response OmpR family regulator